MLRVVYESFVTWQTNEDILRCNPHFHGHPRYDCVMYQTGLEHKSIGFGRLVLIFTYAVDDDTHIPFAIIQPFTVTQTPRIKEKELQFIRLVANTQEKLYLIPACSIIRGVLLVPTFLEPPHAPPKDLPEELYIVDIIDGDMLLRLRYLYPEWYPSATLDSVSHLVQESQVIMSSDEELHFGSSDPSEEEDLGSESEYSSGNSEV